MKYLSFVRSSLTTELMELHREHWPELEGECEVRPIELLASDARGAK